jgi:acetolactate synthase-1/2/3 large subunit
VADVKPALEALDRMLDRRGVKARSTNDLARYRDLARAASERQLGELMRAAPKAGLHPAEVMLAVGRGFGREAVYVTDGGMTSLWAGACLPPTRPRSYHSILELGMLGTGIPSAIGAKLADPSRDVVCVTGDGAAGFNFMEMQSAAREGLKITTIVFAEGSWTMEEPNERMHWGRTFGTAMGEVRWDRVAEGLGCEGLFVDARDALDSVIEHARKSDRPTVICAKTDRDANLAVPGEQMLRFTEVYQGPLG